MNAPRATSTARRPRSRLLTGLAWIIAAPQLLPACAWLVREESYRLDLLANLGAQFLLLAAVSLGFVALFRRRGPAGLLLLCCALHLIPLLTGRAAFWPRDVGPADAERAPGVVRILHYNDSNQSPLEAIERLLDTSNADLVHLLGPSVKAQIAYIYSDDLAPRFTGVIKREWAPYENGRDTKITGAVVASRWPVRAIDLAAEPMGDRLLAGIVERPGAPFAVIAVHPRSPRTEARWIEGNAVVAAIAKASIDFERRGLPVVVLTDLNSTPTGHRSRRLYIDAGLRRCKPALLLDGTHPNQVTRTLMAGDTRTLFRAFWPARIAIDDALVSPGISVDGWTVLPALGSEHSPILMELHVPIPPAGAGSPTPANR